MTDSTTSRRRFLEATGGAATALALAGCTGGGDETTTDTPEDTTEAPDDTTEAPDDTTEAPAEQSGTYRLVNSTATTFDPIAATDTASGTVIQNVFEALTNYRDGTTAVENLLAEDFSVSDDNVSYEFTLRDDATYSNGDSVTAGDLVYSFERLAGSEHSRRASFLLGDLGVDHETETVTQETENEDGEMVEEEVDVYVPGTLALSAPDDTTLEMTLASPFHASLSMLAYTSFSAVPEGIVGDVEGYDGEMDYSAFATESPLGSGPFVLNTWDEATEITLDARPMDEYHGEGPYIEGVHMQIIEQTNPIYTYATINMNADHPSVPPAQYDASLIDIEGEDDMGRPYGTYGPLENGLTVPYYQVAELATYYFAFNTNAVEKPARQAFAYALNQQEINDQVFSGRYKPAYFFTPPGIFPGGGANYNELAQEYPYGFNQGLIPEATQVMEDAGYSESNQYEFTMTTYESATFQQASQLMQDKLGAAHIDMKYEQAPFATLLTRANNGDLDAWSLGWLADYPAPDNFLKLLNPPFTQISRQDNLTYYNWDGTDAAEQAKEGWAAVGDYPLPTDEHQQRRNEGYMQIERANWEDMVMVTLIHSVAEHFTYPWVDKPRVGAMGSSRQKWNRVKIGDRSEYQN